MLQGIGYRFAGQLQEIFMMFFSEVGKEVSDENGDFVILLLIFFVDFSTVFMKEKVLTLTGEYQG
jgi:hypothetical protein